MRQNYLKLLSALLLLVTMTCITTACGDDEPTIPEFSYRHSSDQGDHSVSCEAGKLTISFTTNVNVTARSSEAWCKVSLEKTSEKNVTPAEFKLTVTFDENTTPAERSAVITISNSSGSLNEQFTVTQSAVKLNIPESLGFDRNGKTRSIKAADGGTFNPQCTADWCRVERDGNYLIVRVSATTTDRQAVITFQGRSEQIVVNQTKYTIGETYNENGITGLVSYIGDDERFISKLVHEETLYKWSTSSSVIGASSIYDGAYNTEKVHQQSSWRSKFPLFAAVDELNTGGVTGWYVPAIDELYRMISFIRNDLPSYNRVASSTEGTPNGNFPNENFQAIEYNYGSWQSVMGFKTSALYRVYAIRRF